MTDHNGGLSGDVDRRSVLAAGAATLAMGLAANTEALAQAAPATTAQPPSAKPGRVTVERLKGGVLVIGFERVEAQNRLDPAIILGIGKAYYQLDHDDELRVGVLHGLGPDFSLGGDGPALAAAQAAGTFPPKDPDFLNPFNFAPWPHRAKPVVVAAQGGTKFGAHELFLAADIRVAASDTVFGQGEVTRGLFAWGGATVRFVREAGWGNAMRYLLTGDEWGPDEARRLGLLQEITPPENSSTARSSWLARLRRWRRSAFARRWPRRINRSPAKMLRSPRCRRRLRGLPRVRTPRKRVARCRKNGRRFIAESSR